MRLLLILALTAIGVSLSLLLGGCASTPHQIAQRVSPQGKPYTLVVGALDVPAGCEDYRNGCYSPPLNTVFVPIYFQQHTLDHEEAHVDGMRHTPWTVLMGRYCSTVVVPGGKYAIGDMICVNANSETILQSIPPR
jgi:hypothetical protein